MKASTGISMVTGGRLARRDDAPAASPLHLHDGVGEQARVEVEADGVDEAGLLRAEQVARAANLQVLHGDAEARAKLGRLEDGAQPLLGDGGELVILGVEEVGVGLVRAAPDAPAQLVELREAEVARRC